MFSFINQILDLIIKLGIVFSISTLVYFYLKIRSIDKKIEIQNKEFEKKREEIRLQLINTVFIDGQIKTEERKKEEILAPLKRERERIISKIPFIK